MTIKNNKISPFTKNNLVRNLMFSMLRPQKVDADRLETGFIDDLYAYRKISEKL
ncbi:hypothetical protein MELB17_18594 [Marinobacter sp. ELB17]|nr:hypothetical protein MELB17_18594 [Marinobacter sp. ELB17]